MPRLIVIVVTAILVATPAGAAVITVNSLADASVPVDDGQCTLREAIENANDDDLTHDDCVAGLGIDTIDFSVIGTITLDGEDINILDAVVIDGPGPPMLTISAATLSRIFDISNDSATTVDISIQDLALTAGNAGTGDEGGAIRSQENLTLTNVTITESTALFGGAIYSENASVTIAGSTISGNEAVQGGGGVATVDAPSFVMIGTVVSGNVVLDNGIVVPGPSGGSVHLRRAGSATVENSTFSQNHSGRASGGFVSVDTNGPVTIRNTTFNENIADNGVGAFGIATDSSEPITIDTVRVTGNTAEIVAGVFIQGDDATAVVEITNSEITRNTATLVVGGLYVINATATIANSTIAENDGGTVVGGVAVEEGTVDISLSTISGNEADTAPNTYVAQGILNLDNAIVANAQGPTTADLFAAEGGVFNANYSLIEDPGTVTVNGANNIVGQDPLLGSLQNNGGTTRTLKPAGNSPAVNTGDPAFTPPPATDQRGLPRVVGGRVDMGAVELQTGTLALSSDAYSIAENGGSILITVTRTGGSEGPAAVDYATASGTAVSGADFSSTSGTLNWVDGDDAAKMFSIPIANDSIFEGAEQFTIALTGATGATLGTSSAIVTINDDDVAPTISIRNVTQSEATPGFVFDVELSHATTQTVTFDFDTAGVDATPDVDFMSTSGTLTFDPLITTRQVTVVVNDDAVDEVDETFQVVLSNVNANATIADGIGIGTITDDDPTPSIAIGSVTEVEGDAGTTSFVFDVTLSRASSRSITVDFATAGVDATLDADFMSTSGTLTFAPNVIAQQVTVQVFGDTLDELDETFEVVLSNVNADATIAEDTAVGTITDDDGPPSLSISSVTQAEGSGGTTDFVFTVALVPASGLPVTVDFATLDGTAVAGSDYIARAGTLTFAPGDPSEDIVVQVLGDAAFEPDETFSVVLSNASANATIGNGAGIGTITADDDPVADLSLTKVVSGTGPFVIGMTVTFTITASNNGPDVATNVTVTDNLPNGLDYIAATPSSGSCSGTSTVVCNLGTFVNGASATVTLTARITQSGSMLNTAAATSDVTDPTPAVASAAVDAGANEAAIPTLSEWLLVTLAGALAAAAMLRMRSS